MAGEKKSMTLSGLLDFNLEGWDILYLRIIGEITQALGLVQKFNCAPDSASHEGDRFCG